MNAQPDKQKQYKEIKLISRFQISKILENLGQTPKQKVLRTCCNETFSLQNFLKKMPFITFFIFLKPKIIKN